MHHRDSHQGNRCLVGATKPIVESLEQRQLLAGNVFDVKKIPVYEATSGDLNDFKNGPLGNVGARLGQAYIDYRQYIKKGGKSSAYEAPADSKLIFKDTLVSVSMRTRASIDEMTSVIRKIGGELIIRSKAWRVIDAYVPISQISTLAADKRIATISGNQQIITKSRGVAANQGDEGLNADSLRTALGLTGEGVKIGVISDSVNQVGFGLADSFDSGDLPPPSDIDVLADDTGDDEGRAMLELIHDIAPKASLAFAPATSSQLTFATNIVKLYEAGCDVIVDDIGMADEPIFQEGIINAAITNVTAKGVVYVTAASNYGGSGYQDLTRWVESTDGRFFQDWDPNDSRVDTRISLDFPAGGTIAFFWDDPFNGIVGAPTADLDIQLIDPTTGNIVSTGGLDNNFATARPMEEITVPAGTYDMEVWINNLADGATRPSRIGFYVDTDGALNEAEYQGKSRFTAWGHSSGLDTLSVAAVPFYETPAYDTDGIIETESFTSFGPPAYFFKMDGTRRSQPKTYAKPDLSGVDNVNTSFFGNADVPQDPDKQLNFNGTSAAAPNVAATAALLIQLAKARSLTFTPDTIKDALIESAKTQPTNGAQPGEWDRRGGYGLVNGLEAARALLPELPIPDIVRVVPSDSPRGLDSLTIEFNEPVTGFDISDLILTRKGVSVFDGNQTLSTADNQTFVLSGLKKITNRRGTYKLVLDGANITDSDGNISTGASELFYVSGKPTNVVVTAIAPDELNVTWYDNAVGEQSYRVYRSLNASFSDAEVFDLPAGTEKLRDTGLVPATQYYYKVLPVYQDIEIVSSPSATQNGFTLAQNEIVLDNLSSKGVEIVGDWRSTSDGNKWGLDYIDDKGEGKGDKSVKFSPNIKEAGEYLVYTRWVANDKNATKVPVTVKDGNGVSSTTTVNQRQNTTWKLIGKFYFKEGRKGYLSIGTAGTKGLVVADAARFVKADNGGPDPIDPGTGF